MKVYREEENLIFERGEGVYIYDVKGRKFIDAISSLWCNVHGHNHSELNKALIQQKGYGNSLKTCLSIL